jgi:DNA topoisomerase-1
VEVDADWFQRRRCGRGFSYRTPGGETVRDEETRARFEALAIPPGWTEVRIAVAERGHIQATGRDEEGRKQYIYHAEWRAARDREKYRRLETLGRGLPALRSRVGRDLRREGLPRRRVAAAAVRLLDRLAMRIGHEEYAEENESYGVTTLRKRHVRVSGDDVKLRFEAKGGARRELETRDAALVRIIHDLRSLRGKRLLRYRSEGEILPLRARDVRDYLRASVDPTVTAKDFRTWTGTVCFLERIRRRDPASDDRQAVVLEVLDEVADVLGNTRATTRDFYVHPGLPEAYEAGALDGLVRRVEADRARLRRPGHRSGEALLLALLPHLRERHG